MCTVAPVLAQVWFVCWFVCGHGQGSVWKDSQSIFSHKMKSYEWFDKRTLFSETDENCTLVELVQGQGEMGGALLVTRRNFLLKDEIHCHRKKYSCTGRNIVVQEEIQLNRKKYSCTGRNIDAQEEMYCPKNKLTVTLEGRNISVLESILMLFHFQLKAFMLDRVWQKVENEKYWYKINYIWQCLLQKCIKFYV